MQTDTTPDDRTPDYEWALNALLAVLAELNKGSPDKALEIARSALWNPDRHPQLTNVR